MSKPASDTWQDFRTVCLSEARLVGELSTVVACLNITRWIILRAKLKLDPRLGLWIYRFVYKTLQIQLTCVNARLDRLLLG